ncbi:MAG TPA: DUF3105 domain-containing protein [Nitrospiria bacterium]|jgi:hypothetical protein|nr:DUF3105 domain-containing protein [Nitrospiria bacterium]
MRSLFRSIAAAWLLLGMIAGSVEFSPARAEETKAFVPPGKEVPSLGNNHIQSPGDPHIPYNSVPPTSGPHLPYIAKWGVSKTPIADELQVHNLEDGGVMIQYNCQDCDVLVALLEKFAVKYNKVIVAPYPKMKTPIALTAWGRIDTMDQPDEARIERFIKAYMGIDHHVRE